MILNGDDIEEEVKKGRIGISPFDRNLIGTNSYDVHLSNKFKGYHSGHILDPKKENLTREIEADELGRVYMHSGQFLLGSTMEYCTNDADDLVPMIEGKSSLARLGISIHVTAGFGDVGFKGNWTLEISALHTCFLHVGMRIGQLYWCRCKPTTRRYKGKYQGAVGTVGSLSHLDKA